MITRRNCLIGAPAALICAPAIVRAGNLMAIRGVQARRAYYGFCDRLRIDCLYRSGKIAGRRLCIGTDEFHTPARLADEFVRRFSAEAQAVARNRPFSGTMVPMRYFRNDRRVMSIMIEVNRRLYLDATTGKAGKRFGHVQSMLARVLEAVVELPTAIMMTATASTVNPNSS